MKNVIRVILFVLTTMAFAVLLASSSQKSTALSSPIINPSEVDPFYVENPKKVTPKKGSFFDFEGDLVLTQTVITRPHHEAVLANIKGAVPENPYVVSATTFESPVSYQYNVFLPMIKGTPPTKVVYSVVYAGQSFTTSLGGGYPISESFEMAGMVTAASQWHGYANPSAEPSVRYGLYNNTVVTYSTYPPTQTNGRLNVQSIYTQNNICSKVSAGEVDEVWIWVDGTHNYSPEEFAINGNYYSIGADVMLVPNCGKTVTTLFLNADRSAPTALHSYAHTFDSMLEGQWIPYQYQTCDANTVHLNYWGGAQPQCTGQYAPSDVYGFVAPPSSQYNNNIGVCGDVHYPPNLPYGYSEEYDYSEPITATTRCTDWQWGAGTTSTVSCTSWNCEACPYNHTSREYFLCNDRNEGRFLVWWMQNIPGLNNDSHGRLGLNRPNYWSIKFQ